MITNVQKYAQNPWITKEGRIYWASQRIKRLIINIKSPNVKRINGADKILSIGFRKKFNIPKMKPAMRRSKILPLKDTPLMRRAAA